MYELRARAKRADGPLLLTLVAAHSVGHGRFVAMMRSHRLGSADEIAGEKPMHVTVDAGVVMLRE